METTELKTKHLSELEATIAKAQKKVDARNEIALCHYLPAKNGGYVHHFTLNKMKNKSPKELEQMLEKYIINVDKPQLIQGKERAPRGLRKMRDKVVFSHEQLNQLITLARQNGDKALVALLAPQRPLAACKRDLIASIRQNRLNQELWHAYVDNINALQSEKKA